MSKGFGKSSAMTQSKTIAPDIKVPRPVLRPVSIPRPSTVITPRGANPARIQAREIKREGLKQASQNNLQKPVFTVRPAAPPVKIMPKQPLPRPFHPPVVRPGTLPTPGKQAVKPTTGVSATQQLNATSKRPAPVRPPTFKPSGAGVASIGSLALNSAQADPQIANEVYMLNSSISDLQNRSTLSQVQADVTELDSAISRLVGLLESARNKGFVYQKNLDEETYRLMDQWVPIYENVLRDLPQQAASLQNSLIPLSSQVGRLNSVMRNPTAAQPMLSNTYSQVNSLVNNVNKVEGNLRNSYSLIESQVGGLTTQLNTIHWMLGQFEESKVELAGNENLVMAVQARWDQSGENDPEGLIFLTNKRLVFERKEKVATKKILFITMSSELVQEVLIDQALSAIESVKAVNKGLFGHQDFIEVQYADKKLGIVPFHINGQESTAWVTLIEKAQSGAIEEDHTTGSGLSYADITGPITTADLLALQNEVNKFQDVVTLKAVRDEIAAIENDTRELDRKLANLRNRGYVIEKSLDVDVAVLMTQWDRIKTNADAVLNNQVALLSTQMVSLQKMMAELAGQSGNLQAARPTYMQLRSTIASTDAQADAADDAVIAQYDEYADEVEALTAHMEWIVWMLDALSTASFKLYATESGVAATEAIWDREGFEPENGILFLTDQRILWEERVETFELEFNLPVVEILDVIKDTDSITGDEYLKFSLSTRGPYPVTRFRLALPVGDSWLKMIGRARSGDYAVDRAVEIDQKELERIRNAPRQCSNCGAGLSNTIFRGQTEITCEYCGIIIRI
jgi:hypothetical protein